ncbi:MAG: hypothetical protein MUP71_13640 [Candidatus Aminicenantes bacterium]|nr:hypothetical protein [Candidatus Aminicenantes bacterium]
MAGLLIAKGADVNVMDKRGSKPLQCAKENHNENMAYLLKRHGESENEKN